MKPIYFLSFFSLLLLASSSANAGDSMLRVTCEGDDVGAEVSVNGIFKGECPLDMQVAPGMLTLRVEKKDPSYERVFEQEIRMGDGVVKKVEAVLSKRLNAAGQRLEDERLATERLAVERLAAERLAVERLAAERRQRQQAEEAASHKYVSQGGLTWMPVTFDKNWSEANSYCANTAINGQSGWRLPTKEELVGLYNSGAMKGQGWTLRSTWSSTPDSRGRHYFVNLTIGHVNSYIDTYTIYVTCVR